MLPWFTKRRLLAPTSNDSCTFSLLTFTRQLKSSRGCFSRALHFRLLLEMDRYATRSHKGNERQRQVRRGFFDVHQSISMLAHPGIAYPLVVTTQRVPIRNRCRFFGSALYNFTERCPACVDSSDRPKYLRDRASKKTFNRAQTDARGRDMASPHISVSASTLLMRGGSVELAGPDQIGAVAPSFGSP